MVLLEFGVGYNTPGIIRFPFEQMTFQNKNWNLIRFNKYDLNPYLELDNRFIGVSEDIRNIINESVPFK